ncbi:hypothetical protein ACFLQU_00705 [Verrucomicrobiota bacterium]
MRTVVYAMIGGTMLAATLTAGELKPVDGEAPLRAGWCVCEIEPKPAETLAREPTYKSSKPLYMTLPMGSGDDAVVTVVLDESKGDGKGYDLLHIDGNNNGNLTDDDVVKPKINERAGSRSFAIDPQDITVKYADGSSMKVRVQLEVRGYESGKERRIKWTGAYHVARHLEGRADFGDRKGVLVGLYDSSAGKVHANACFSDNGVDRIRIDVDGDGKLDARKEDLPMSTVVSAYGKLWSLALGKGGGSLSAVPYAGPTGTVRFEGKFASGAAVADAVESYAEIISTGGSALRLPLSGGRPGVVPVGDYRVSRAHLKVMGATNVLWESFFFTTNDVRVAAAQVIRIKIGAPLKLEPEFQGKLALGEHVCILPHVVGGGRRGVREPLTSEHTHASHRVVHGLGGDSGQQRPDGVWVRQLLGGVFVGYPKRLDADGYRSWRVRREGGCGCGPIWRQAPDPAEKDHPGVGRLARLPVPRSAALCAAHLASLPHILWWQNIGDQV